MNEQQARSLLMEFIYDEISPENKEKLIHYLENHPEMMDELKDLRKMQKLLREMPEVEKSTTLRIVEPKKRSFAQWLHDTKTLLPQSGWGKTALATAACVLLLLIAGSAANLQITSGQAGVSLSLGYANQPVPVANTVPERPNEAVKKSDEPSKPEPQKNVLTKEEAEQFFTDKEAKILLAKLYEQNEQLLTAFAEQMNKQDQKQLQKIVKYFQAQRMYDLKRIEQGLNRTQLANAYRWQQTNQVLVDYIQASASDVNR